MHTCSFTATNVCSIDLHPTAHVVVAVFQPLFAYTLRKEPSAFLSDAKFTNNLCAGMP